MKEGDIRAKGQTKVVALPADNSRKNASKNYTPSPSVHDNEAINIAKECPVRAVMNTKTTDRQQKNIPELYIQNLCHN
jgi:hypothetical protein